MKTQGWVLTGGAIAIAAVAAFLVLRQRPSLAPSPPIGVHTPQPAETAPTPPADCLLPGPAPVMPDGLSASAAEMKAGHDRIQHFVDQLGAYQACRNAQHDHAGPNVSAKQKQDWLDQGDAAVDQANALARTFSARLAAFKAHHPGP